MDSATQLRINLIDIKDYIYMRKQNMATKIKWEVVRSLNIPGGGTFCQYCMKLEGDRFYLQPNKGTLHEFEKEYL